MLNLVLTVYFVNRNMACVLNEKWNLKLAVTVYATEINEWILGMFYLPERG